ncbi:MAG: hypothetical protein ACREMF_10465 [Gemmatimonadales bacterium]
MDAPGFQRVAEIEVDLVKPERHGFTLTGQGADRAEYRLDVHFDIPLDARTRAVLGGLLAQSELTISRRPPPSLATPLPRRERAHRTPGRRVTAD